MQNVEALFKKSGKIDGRTDIGSDGRIEKQTDGPS